ncbi:hypothetical protein APHAL10511_008495 [Amanita phalloides]|nr:hypothetical protein APHAL10511_008495 [Amanita phalloides]
MASSFNKTLQFITAVKLQELTKQRHAFQTTHVRVLNDAKATGNAVAKTELLRKAISSWPGALSNDVVNGALDLDNLELWIRQAKQDPGFGTANLERWADSLETHIHRTIMRFDCAKLFGNLFQEWMSSGDSAIGGADGQRKKSDEFIDVGRKEKVEQMDRFMSFVFEEKTIDNGALRGYLSTIFSSKRARKALEDAQDNMKEFCDSFRDETISKKDVTNAIDAFLSGHGSLSDDNITALREFRQNDSVITELSSVLTMRLAAIDTWSWPAEGIPVQMRRHLNGKYRAFTDPDIIDALLLHHIGISWQVQFRKIFFDMFCSKAWITTLSKMPEKEKRRLEEQLGAKATEGMASQRLAAFSDTFFLCTLSSSSQIVAGYDKSADTSYSPNASTKGKSPVEIKQQLLHLLTTESRLNTKLHDKFAVVCSDFEWFGPSLPHDAILTVLEFFGVTKEWLDFFKKWLAAPLRFSNDDNSEGVRVRKRGTPFNYTLSTVCGETIMFIMDFAVNQASDGLHLYRLHDDLWLFDADTIKCARAWKEMNTYADLVGLTFNKEKTGSACIGQGQSQRGLPSGDVRWGFLKFDSNKGRFAIDQADVDTHIQELRRQLSATKSVLGWVNAYNKYMAFLYRNFGGHPTKSFGEEHLDDLLGTFARIQSELFKDTKHKSAVAYLQSVIEQRFSMSDLPEGYFYFPIATGGLELKNPFIELCSISRESDEDKKPKEIFEELMEQDDESYESCKNQWVQKHKFTMDPFMSYDEFLSFRDIWVAAWGVEYQKALQPMEREVINQTPAITASLPSSKYWVKAWFRMSVEERWLVALYGQQLMDKFGALDVVHADLIPLSMVELFKRSRIQLDE